MKVFFIAQLEKSREAVDAANIRAAYAEVMTAVLTDDDTTATAGITVDQKQTKADWQTTIDWPDGLAVGDIKTPADSASTGYWTVKWDATNEKVVAE